MRNFTFGPSLGDDRADNHCAPGTGVGITGMTKGGVDFLARAGAVLVKHDVPVVSRYLVPLGFYFLLGQPLLSFWHAAQNDKTCRPPSAGAKI
jgi:hypothetical protein